MHNAQFHQQETPGEHGILHSVELSHIRIHKIDIYAYIWDIYQLPQITACYELQPPTFKVLYLSL